MLRQAVQGHLQWLSEFARDLNLWFNVALPLHKRSNQPWC